MNVWMMYNAHAAGLMLLGALLLLIAVAGAVTDWRARR